MSEEEIQNNNPQPSGIDSKSMEDYTGDTPPADGDGDKDTNNNGSDTPPEENGEGEGKSNQEEIYGAPESYDYSKIQLPEDMTLDEEMVAKFNPIAKELNLSNESANRLMSLAVELTGKNAARFSEAAAQLQIAEKNSYLELLDKDQELNSYSTEEYDQYLSVAKLGVDKVATNGFKQILKDKGLANHPEFIKTFHAIGKLCKEDSPAGNNTPAGVKVNPASVLYPTMQ